MRRFLVILCTLFSCLYVSAYQKTCSPEQFGAKGDGVHDDYPAFRDAVKSSSCVILSSGRTYRLKSSESMRMFDVDHSLRIIGNGAIVIVDAGAFRSVYPSSPAYAYLDVFGNDGRRVCVDNFSVENVTFLIDANTTGLFSPHEQSGMAGFLDGDFFLFSVSSVTQSYRNVKVLNEGKFNNFNIITVLRGDNLIIIKCDFRNQSLGHRGGILWMMLDKGSHSDILVRESSFLHDTHDESFCLSILDSNSSNNNSINASFRNCSFESHLLCENSGFFILYDNRALADAKFNANLHFDKCRVFNRLTVGSSPSGNRKFMSCQGSHCIHDCNVSFVNTSFESELPHSNFNGDPYFTPCFFSPRKLSDRQNSEFIFKKCRFKTNNSVIDPYCGEKKGEYLFNSCSFDCYAVCESSVNNNVDFSAYFTSCSINSIQPFTINCNEYYSKCNFYLPCDSLFVRSEWDGRYEKEFKGIRINGKSVGNTLNRQNVDTISWSDSRGLSRTYYGYEF